MLLGGTEASSSFGWVPPPTPNGTERGKLHRRLQFNDHQGAELIRDPNDETKGACFIADSVDGEWNRFLTNLVIQQVSNEREASDLRQRLHAGNSSRRPHLVPLTISAAAAILFGPPSRVGRDTGLAATELCARKGERERERAIIFLSTCGFSFVSVSVSLSLSLPPSPASSIKRASFDSARPRAAGEWRREGGTSGLRLSKNEMRLKKQGRPSSRPRSRSFSRRRGMGVLMSTYLSPRSVEQNSEAARREQYFASTNMGAQLSYRVQPPAF